MGNRSSSNEPQSNKHVDCVEDNDTGIESHREVITSITPPICHRDTKDEINSIQNFIFGRLSCLTDIDEYQANKKSISDRLDAAFSQGVSSSIFVVGPSNSDKASVLDNVISQYENTHGIDGGKPIIARVSGMHGLSDNHALLCIIDQFVMRDSNYKSSSIILEDLESLLRVSELQ